MNEYSIAVYREKSNSTRVWYLCSDFETAEKIVLNNESDIFEYYYDYAIIEEIEVVVKGKACTNKEPKQWWYKAEYKDGNVTVEKCLVLDRHKNICNWSIG